MRIATWNINGMKARLPYLCHWLESRRPDVVGLQELKMLDDQFPHEELAELGYAAVTHGQKAWNGVAVLTRGDAAEITSSGLPGQEEMGARLLDVAIDGLSFVNVYVPNGKTLEHEDYGRKLAWYEALATYIETKHRADEALVLCGDFNVCPAAIDSHAGAAADGEIFHSEAERACVGRLLDWGLVDLFRDRHPEEKMFSWWDYRGGSFHRNHGLRIDFLLATESVRARVGEVGTDRDYRKKKDDLQTSDHAPVVADLE